MGLDRGASLWRVRGVVGLDRGASLWRGCSGEGAGLRLVIARATRYSEVRHYS